MDVTRSELISLIQAVSREEFSRSGGPGGQNVNKVNTKVTLRVPLGALIREGGLTEADATLAARRLAGRINEAGELVLQISDTRSQRMNREIAVERAADLLVEALRTRKRRRPTRPGAAARERRLQVKGRRARNIRNRRIPEE